MPKPFEINLDVRAGRERASQALDPGAPFRIVILGDFSGRASRGMMETGTTLAGRRALLVDRDNFEGVLENFGVVLRLPLQDREISLRFSDLEDFHPDRLFERLPLFQRLREIRGKLSDPSTFRAAAAELGVSSPERSSSSAPSSSVPVRAASAIDLNRGGSGSLLDDAIKATEGQSGNATPSRAPDEFASFLTRAVAPHLVAKADPQQAEIVALIDRAASAQMRALLHLPAFQEIEAAWRALFFLVRRIETDTALKLYLADVSKAELTADLIHVKDLRDTGLYKLLVEKTVRTPGAETWSLLVGNYTFGMTLDDLTLLNRLGAAAAAAGAPFIACADPGLLGCASAPDLQEPRMWKDTSRASEAGAWEALRGQPEAEYLGLAIPRFLLRLPYGKETDAAVQFDFEEITAPAHEEYLWGNPAFLCACLLARDFAEDGWALRPGTNPEIEGLPLHIYKQDGESMAKPCAETLLPVDAADRILESGLMPVASLKGQDAVRLVRFQSIANPLKPLRGQWGA